MSKVYASAKLNYGKVTKFSEPAELKNDPIYADANFENVFNSGDSLQENEDDNAGDFFNEGKREELILFEDDKMNKEKKKTDSLPASKDQKKDEQTPKAVMSKPENRKADDKGKNKPSNDY